MNCVPLWRAVKGRGIPPGFSFPLEGRLMHEPLISPGTHGNSPDKVVSNSGEAHVHQSISRGYNDLINGHVHPWKQAKVEADRMREAR